MLFEYVAISKKGKKMISMISAQNLLEAKEILYAKEIFAIKVKPLKLKAKKHLSKKETLLFFIDLKNLLNASLPLYESLLILSEKNSSRKIKCLIVDICDNIKNGDSFSSSLKKHPKSFDLIICSMIENAQKTGGFIEALDEIIKNSQNSLKLKKTLVASLTYPAILLTFCAIILTALMFFIIPTLFDLFQERELHPFTKFVLNSSKFFCSNKIPMLISLLIFILFGLMVKMIKKLREQILIRVLSLPLIKPFMIKLALIRFCRSLSHLLIGSESYDTAFALATNVLKHPLLEKEIKPLKEKLIEGENLSSLLKKSSLVPSLVPQMLTIAEETAKMPSILLNIAKIYEEEIEKTTTKLTTMLQPIILIILGIIIGFVVLSVLLPLTDVSSFIGE